jgi:hypothetical protein
MWIFIETHEVSNHGYLVEYLDMLLVFAPVFVALLVQFYELMIKGGLLFIAQTVGWAKPDPIHWMAITVGGSTHCHLR